MGSTFKALIDPLDISGMRSDDRAQQERKDQLAREAADRKASATPVATTTNNTEMQAVDTNIMKRNALKGATSASSQLGVL